MEPHARGIETSASTPTARRALGPPRPSEQGVDAPVNTEVSLTPEQASIWTYGAEQVGALNRMDYGKMNAAKPDWIERWNEIFGM